MTTIKFNGLLIIFAFLRLNPIVSRSPINIKIGMVLDPTDKSVKGVTMIKDGPKGACTARVCTCSPEESLHHDLFWVWFCIQFNFILVGPNFKLIHINRVWISFWIHQLDSGLLIKTKHMHDSSKSHIKGNSLHSRNNHLSPSSGVEVSFSNLLEPRVYRMYVCASNN